MYPQNGPPRTNVPSTLDAYIAPLKNDTITTPVVGKDTANNIVKQTTVKQTSYYNSANNNSANNNSSANSNSKVVQQPGNRTPSGFPPKWGGGTYCARCSEFERILLNYYYSLEVQFFTLNTGVKTIGSH